MQYHSGVMPHWYDTTVIWWWDTILPQWCDATVVRRQSGVTLTILCSFSVIQEPLRFRGQGASPAGHGSSCSSFRRCVLAVGLPTRQFNLKFGYTYMITFWELLLVSYASYEVYWVKYIVRFHKVTLFIVWNSLDNIKALRTRGTSRKLFAYGNF